MLQRICKLLGFKTGSFAKKPIVLVWDKGDTVPADGTAGYATGAIFMHTDGGEGTALYVNEGSVTSSDFNAVSALTAAQEALIGATAGVLTASKAIVVNADKHVDVLETASLKLGATGATVAVTATAAELNTLAAANADMTPGTGISGGTGTICEHSVEKIGGLIKTTILVDLTGLNSSAAADVIGKQATANCHIGQITAAKNGAIFAGRVSCLETPAGGEPDIDLYSSDVATGTEDVAITDAALGTEAALLDAAADWTAEMAPKGLTANPAANTYLYLVGSGGGTDNIYTAGILLIELWGK